MAKRLIPIFTLFTFAILAAGATPAAAFACGIDGFPGDFVPGGSGEQLGYSTTGEQPAGDKPSESPANYAPAPSSTSTSLGMMLVLGVALLAAPLFATFTVVAARLNQRR